MQNLMQYWYYNDVKIEVLQLLTVTYLGKTCVHFYGVVFLQMQ